MREMGAHREKRDRTARLLKIQVLLGQNPRGLNIREIARRCSVSVRTVYRDLAALEQELNVPVWQEGKKRGLAEGYHLPPIPLTIPEAMNISLAARLMQSSTRWYDPHRVSILVKLNSVVPLPLREQIENTISWMEKQPHDARQIEVSEKLANAWIMQRQVTISYREEAGRKLQEFTIEPYSIEPATPGNSGFVIANCLQKKSVFIFKIGCIEKAREEPGRYHIPDDFDSAQYLSPIWGVHRDEPAKAVKLRFKSRPSRPIMGAIWDPSQNVEPQPDGSLVVALRVVITSDFLSWVLGWGDEVEVIEPEEFRDRIIEVYKSVRRIYAIKNDSPK